MTEAVPFITADILAGVDGVRHAFFTRRGGVSGGIYATLNCGPGSGDDGDSVAENRNRAMTALGGASDSLVTAYQVHSARAARVDGPWPDGRAEEVDGLVTTRPGLALGILAADCAPVLLSDAEAGVIGACHAGWRGALAGILEATVEAMAKSGAEPRRILAAVGPCIGHVSYEVGPEFPAPFLAENPANAVFFSPAEREGHHLFALPGYVVTRLQRIGIGCARAVGRDTFAEGDLFFSYRRATRCGERDYGRNLSAIMLRPA